MEDHEKTALLNKNKTSIEKTKTYIGGNESNGYISVNASTWFQLLLYYNILASIVYFFAEGTLLIYRLQTFIYQNHLFSHLRPITVTTMNYYLYLCSRFLLKWFQ